MKVWMINTGWTGGAYGTGHRIDLNYTRAMISAVLDGKMDNAIFVTHPLLGLDIPLTCPGVPSEILDPQNTWKDPEAYVEKAKELASRFKTNFKKYEDSVSEEIRHAGPPL